MESLFQAPISIALAVTFGVFALLSLAGAAKVISHQRPWPEVTPMLRPIRAWRMLIFGAAMALTSAGFALQLGWLLAFGAIVAFVETIEASIMLYALGNDELERSREPAPGDRDPR